MEVKFDKYEKRGSMHWREMVSRDIRKFNSFQQGRYDWILKVLGDVRAKNVLDIGCGDGALSYMLADVGARVTGVDNEAEGIEFANRNLDTMNTRGGLDYKFVVTSAYELPFQDNEFDEVVSCELIEHLDKPEQMLSEAKRVLRPGGRLILTTPHRITEKPGDKYHVQEFFPEELTGLVKGYFDQVRTVLTHHVFWYGLFTYSAQRFKNRQFGKWLINALTLWFGWNPFLIEYSKPTKRDVFTEILIEARK